MFFEDLAYVSVKSFAKSFVTMVYHLDLIYILKIQKYIIA